MIILQGLVIEWTPRLCESFQRLFLPVVEWRRKIPLIREEAGLTRKREDAGEKVSGE